MASQHGTTHAAKRVRLLPLACIGVSVSLAAVLFRSVDFTLPAGKRASSSSSSSSSVSLGGPGFEARSLRKTAARALEPDTEQEVAKIRWLEPLDPKTPQLEAAENATVLPVFPLGGPFMPYTKQTLQIFEPRYRELYDNILFSGSRRFVVTPVDPQSETLVRLGAVGVVFYLDDLKEVSEMTQDQVKYVCEHSIIGRVRLNRILNPAAWFDRSTYLRAETEPLEDVDQEVDSFLLEDEVMSLLNALIPLYAELGLPTYKPSLLEERNSSRAEENGLWSLGEVWMQLLGAQLQTKRKNFQDRLQEMVRPYAQGTDLRLSDLPEDVTAGIRKLEAEYQALGNRMVMQQLEFGQQLIQTDSHRGRLEQFKATLDEEYRSAIAQKSLKSLGDR